MATKSAPSTGRIRAKKPTARPGPSVQLFGHVILVEGYAQSNFVGAHALVKLRDTPGKTIAVLTTQHRLQTLLEAGLMSGNLVAVSGYLVLNPTVPSGGWTVDVYNIDGVILYSMP